MFVDFTDLALDGSVLLTRAASPGAAIVGATGVVSTQATANTPRFSHFLSGARWLPALLLEEARTNLLLRGHEINNPAWGKTDTTITADATISPDGTQNADLCTQGSGSLASIGQGTTVAGGVAHTFSIFLKRANNDWIRLQISDGTNAFLAWFNLAVGTLGSTANTAAPTATSYGIENVGNGWYRCRVTATLAGANVSGGVMAATGNASSSRVSGGSYYAWGGQLEAGATATSYIPTISSAQTRAAETAYMQVNEGGSDVPYTGFQQGQGAVAIEFMLPAVNTARNSHLFTYSDGTNSNYVAGYVSTAGAVVVEVVTGGVVQASLNLGAYTAGAASRLAATWAANRFTASLNGGAVKTVTSGSVPVASRLDLMNRPDGTRAGNGYICWMIASNAALADADVPSFAATFVSVGVQSYAPIGQSAAVIEATLVAVGANDNAPAGQSIGVVEATNFIVHPLDAAPTGLSVAVVEATVVAVGVGRSVPHGRSIRLIHTPVVLVVAETPAARRGVATQGSRRGLA